MPTRFSLRLVPTTRGFPIRRWLRSPAAWFVFGYFAILAGVSLAGRFSPVPVVTCGFRLATGRPCAGCGATRIVFGLFEGKLVQGFLLNPMAFVCIMAAINLFLLKVLFARRVRLRMSAPVTVACALALMLLLAANWVYVLRTHPPTPRPVHPPTAAALP